MSKQIVAQLVGASKQYKTGDQLITALSSTDLLIQKSELILIIGPSGSGKTTLLSLLGCVIYPTAGELIVNGQQVNVMNEKQRSKLRLSTIGFVFQSFNLLAPLNAAENVAIPLKLQKVNRTKIKERVTNALEMVGMESRRKNLPRELSGGQQQRVAVARALVTDPSIILCDEPTASLDKDSLKTVMEELRSLATDHEKSVVVVTHDPRLENYADRIIEVNNGQAIEKFNRNENALNHE